MGYQFDIVPGTITTPPTVLNSTTQSQILTNGPYYTVTNPYYQWNGSCLRSATDADLNIFMAYYIADKLSTETGWHDSDINPAITNPSSLAHFATGKGVTWNHMKQNVARSFNENTGGSSYGAYQNTSGNILLTNYGNPNPISTVGLGHDSDINADSSIHLDYTDLRAYQLLDIEQTNA
jgi:hypothetical protein